MTPYGIPQTPVQRSTGIMPRLAYRRAAALVLLVVIVVGSLAVHAALPTQRQTGTDIYYNWVEGQNILSGQNPYARILSSDMRVNQKYPTYFPLIYYLSSLTQQFGLKGYPEWLAFWRILILAFIAATGCLIYGLLYRQSGLIAAGFGALFWFLNRWTLQSSQAVTYDVIPIFLLLVSLWLLPRRKLAALLMLSLSLAFKQLDAILVPLYLINAWQSVAPGSRARWRAQIQTSRLWAVARAGLALASIPTLVSIPFFFWPGRTIALNALAFFRSMVFEVTRDAALHVAAPSLDSLFGVSGGAARLPTLVMLLLVYGLYTKGKIRLFTACLLAMAAFIDFNSVLFLQYFCWMVPFIPLVILEVWAGGPAIAGGSPAARGPQG
jgi:hypothetical protein